MQADKSWTKIWVEGYEHGERMEPFHLIELSYGQNPQQQVVEGPMGFGIIEPGNEEPLFFLYSVGVAAPPRTVGMAPFQGVTRAPDYTIGEEPIGLKSGETKLLAAYRLLDQNTVRGLDLNNIDQEIKESDRILLLKIQVEEQG